MTENLMSRIAQMLGLELDEPFKIKGFGDDIFTLTKYGLWKEETEHLWDSYPVFFSQLCTGTLEIIKLPWIPKIGDYYWTFDKSNTSESLKWTIGRFKWENSPFDMCVHKSGWVFRTQKEAEKALPAIAREFGASF